MNPKISILMSAYNAESFIASAIKSVLDQSFKDFECVIVNDGSTDGTDKIIEQFRKSDPRIHVIHNEKNIGLTRSLNMGLSHCLGDYIARLDADDVCANDRLEMQYKLMESTKDIALCGSSAWYLDENDKKIGEKNLPTDYVDIKKKLLFNNQFVHSSLFIRKNVLDKEGFYNESFKASQDYELILRIASKYRVENISKHLVGWRVEENSLSWSSKRQEWDAIHARWWGITKYSYPKLVGLFHIILRIGWLCLPQKMKMKRYAH
ncbi:glycosyltransferase family 2 protein [Candidatus Parcubacteria bacterium]|nr:glycosyltransferase family 2 protein [Candidatus Parcubacteria bacterium]MBT3948978.1 glycosyltransferase family 2 protein [Candidatus Parcubacteria bacterium]